MKTIFYVAAAYMGVVGMAAFVSNVSANSPTADALAGLPSVGTFLGANNVKTEGGINLVSALALFSLAYLDVV